MRILRGRGARATTVSRSPTWFCPLPMTCAGRAASRPSLRDFGLWIIGAGLAGSIPVPPVGRFRLRLRAGPPACVRRAKTPATEALVARPMGSTFAAAAHDGRLDAFRVVSGRACCPAQVALRPRGDLRNAAGRSGRGRRLSQAMRSRPRFPEFAAVPISSSRCHIFYEFRRSIPASVTSSASTTASAIGRLPIQDRGCAPAAGMGRRSGTCARRRSPTAHFRRALAVARLPWPTAPGLLWWLA